ncbi:MAG: RsmD family RNA methyltransferase [Bacteroidales bacterium]|nr:RsmD family RNA methyltransferase [Bacteroidales bacterium]
MTEFLFSDQEKEFIEKNKDFNVNELALKIKDGQNFRSKYVLRQISGRQLMKNKMPLWEKNSLIVYPEHLPLEQCSSLFTACYKRKIVEKNLKDFSLFVDLTGGFAVDFFSISEVFKKAFYVELNTELCEIVRHNFGVLGRKNASFFNADGVVFLKNTSEKFNLIFIDPARRDSKGKKTVRIQDCEPDITEFEDIMLEKSDLVMIKLSPMLDISNSLSQLKNVKEIHITAFDNECKEIIILQQKNYFQEPEIHTVNGDENFSFFYSDEQKSETVFWDGEILEGKFLFEPNVAVMKSGAFKILTEKFPIKKLHASSHLYVSDTDVYDFPGRRFKIVKASKPKDFSGMKANLAVRNFPVKAEDLKKKLNIKDGGDVFLFATTLMGGKKIIIQGEKLVK